jgi:hypothetical protein
MNLILRTATMGRMDVVCPRCAQTVDSDDVNVSKDVAYCRPCDQVFPLSDIVDAGEAELKVDTENPPRGAWYRDDGDRVRAGATLRSPIAFFLVPFTCVWAGGALGGIYGAQIARGEINWVMSLFGLPFVVGSVFLIGLTLLMVFGKVEVRIKNDESEVFTGVGPFGKHRRFHAQDVLRVKEEQRRAGKGQNWVIALEREDLGPIQFGTGLTEERRRFVLGALRAMLGKDARRR